VGNLNLRVWIVAAAIGLLGVILVINRWKSAEFTGVNSAETYMPMQGMQGDGLPQQEISRIEFLNAVFEKTKPSPLVTRVLTAKAGSYPKDSLELALRWAEETENVPLVALLQTDLSEQFGDATNETQKTETARNLIFSAAMSVENPMAAAYLFQLGKKHIDKGLEKNPKNSGLLNALIVYQSEYLNAPMQFLGTLKSALAADSNNIETHYIHLNLLKKSQQWPKALKKCEKLISLQPQNPRWLFEMSEVFGFTGDSVNAKVYLDLAVETQKSVQ
jgi:tetratricopeptide (TPR) repeat protein